MSTPTRVTIVRPPADWQGALGRFVGGAIVWPFLAAWLLVWLAPFVWPEYPLGYWQSYALVWIVRWLNPSSGTSYMAWTERRKP